MLGPIFAIYRPIVAFISGLLGGTFVAILDNKNTVLEIHNHLAKIGGELIIDVLNTIQVNGQIKSTLQRFNSKFGRPSRLEVISEINSSGENK